MVTRRQIAPMPEAGARVANARIGRLAALMALVVALLMAAAVSGCSAGSDSMPAVDERFPANGDRADLPQEGGGDDGDRLIIRTKTLRLEVARTNDALDQIRDLTRTHAGTVSDLQVATDSEEWVYRNIENGDGAALRGWVTVRVPTAGYEDFIAAVARLGVVKFQAEATSDVTQEHLDLSARLENLRAQEVRLRAFFDAAKNVEDMLAVEKELGRVRGDIESLDAQVTFLERQAAMATITVELTEPRAVVRPGGESWGFVDSITSGVRGAAALVTGLITFLIATAPLWIVGGVAYLVIRAVLRRRRARKNHVAPMSPDAPMQTPAGAPAAPEAEPDESP